MQWPPYKGYHVFGLNEVVALRDRLCIVFLLCIAIYSSDISGHEVVHACGYYEG